MSTGDKNMDDLFRERFENFEVEPPAHVWENVKTQIAADKGGMSGGKPFLNGGLAGLIVILISVGILSFFILSNSFKLNEVSSEDLPTNSMDGQLAVNATPENQTTQWTEEKGMAETPENELGNDTPSIEETNDTDTNKKENKKRKKGKTQVSFDAGLTETVPADKYAKSTLSVDRNAINVNKLIPDAGSRVLFETHSSGTFISLSADYPFSDSPMAEKQRRNRNDYFVKGSWKMGLYFTPEMIVYPSDNGLKNYSNSIELNASYHTNNLIFQSGIGVSVVTDQGDNLVEYRKYLGSYEDVYDVTIDTTNNGLLDITYYTNTVNVYDSVASEVISPTKRKFTYLQIPALFGYGKESRRFGWFVKGGPSLMLLIDQNIPETSMANSSDMVMNSENSLPGKRGTQWQFIMSAGASYKLGNRLSVSIEPTFKYHINSAYEKSYLNTKHPYSIGLRTGLLLNL